MSTTSDAIKLCQAAIAIDDDDKPLVIDGIAGPKTRAAFAGLVAAALANPSAAWPPVASPVPQTPQPLPSTPGRVLSSSAVPWTVAVDGADLVVNNIIATCFGGGNDAGDNGQTESGVMNDGSNPNLLGVALPIRSAEAATAGSPLAFKGPHIPWGTLVKVWRTASGERTAVLATAGVIDNGPDTLQFPTHGIDLTVAMAAQFAPSIPVADLANDWSEDGFSYRILGGAAFVS